MGKEKKSIRKFDIIFGSILLVIAIVIIIVVTNQGKVTKEIKEDVVSNEVITNKISINEDEENIEIKEEIKETEEYKIEIEGLDKAEKNNIEKYLSTKYLDSNIIKEFISVEEVDDYRYIYCKDKEDIIFTIVVQQGMLFDNYAYYMYSEERRKWEENFVNVYFRSKKGEWFADEREMLWHINDTLLTDKMDTDKSYIKKLDTIGQTWEIVVKEWTEEDSKRIEENLGGLEGNYSVYIANTPESEEMFNKYKDSEDIQDWYKLIRSSKMVFQKRVLGGKVLERYVATDDIINNIEEGGTIDVG